MAYRPTWDEYFGWIAEMVSSRATCPRAEVGAVLVKDNRIIGTGYNGSPPGEPHCRDVGCDVVDDHCQRAIHAEVNAVVHTTTDIRGARLYLYDSLGRDEPCRECAKVLRSGGISW